MQSCLQFDKVWIAKAQDIKNHAAMWASSSTLLSSVSAAILDWPARGNKRHAVVPTEDDLAPFVDVNKNGIYDPENGDYPKIKGDEAHFSVVNDVSTGRLDSPSSKAIGREMHILSYLYYSSALNGLGTSLFQDCKIIKKTAGAANDFIFSLYVDPDLANFRDDYVGCDTMSNTGFTYNSDDFDENTSVLGYLNNPPWVSTSFMNRKMSTFSYFINGQGDILNDPVTSIQMRNGMQGNTRLGGNFTVGNDGVTPGFPATKFLFFGNPSNNSEWSMSSVNFSTRDLRYLMSTKQINLEQNKPQEFNFVTYIHQYEQYNVTPNFRDSVLPEIEKVKNYITSQDCKITLTAKITPDINRMKKGKIDLTSIGNSQGILNIKWSSQETTQSINSKDSGKYHIAVIDANNCMKNSTFYIPNISKGTGSLPQTSLDYIVAYPISFHNQLTIENPSRITVEIIYIFDIVGKLVYQKNIHEKKERLDIGLTLLPRGNYRLAIETDQGVKNFTISK